ncbi:MAG: 3-phosphoshikimate 1-carboxyvinyltransferase [Pseudomonadota bacterium]
MTALAGPLIARAAKPLVGRAKAPGDKSISHRALIFGALANGVTKITGLLEGDDVLRTAAAMRAFGADVERDGAQWLVTGKPWRGPPQSIYLGNSGTGARLIIGAAAGAGVAASFDGDSSLRRRPMGRVLEPLRLMGLTAGSSEERLPLSIEGTALKSISVRLSKPSAQVKSAILLAALGADGVTEIHEPQRSRDHTERLFGLFGIDLAFEGDGAAGRFIRVKGPQYMRAAKVNVPGDPSSAAFLIATALITPGSDIIVEGVMLNPLRAGFYAVLKDMGADIQFENQREEAGETVADIRARHSTLHGVDVPASWAPTLIDEYPILSVVAAFAQGETRMSGLEELRVKESDRIASMEAGLSACGVSVSSGDDWMAVRGREKAPGGAKIRTDHDHRIAMSFLTLGCASAKPVEIDDASMIATSFPEYLDTMHGLGADIQPR